MPHSDQDVDVSVLTPCLNYGRFLPDAVASVAAQGPRVEHIVQDGGSTDETLEVLRSSGVASWESAPDSGQSDALNRAFVRARGRWIAWLNADEFLLPGALEALVREGDRSQADLVFGDIVEVDEVGRFLRLRAQHRYNSFAMRNFGPHIASCAMIVRREALTSPPWDTSLGVTMDWDLYLGLDQRGARFRYLPQPVGAFRLHGEQVTADPDAWHMDYGEITTKHSLHRNRFRVLCGLAVHRALKVLNGAFKRQWAARGLRGRDFRWFRREVGPDAPTELLSLYRR